MEKDGSESSPNSSFRSVGSDVSTSLSSVREGEDISSTSEPKSLWKIQTFGNFDHAVSLLTIVLLNDHRYINIQLI